MSKMGPAIIAAITTIPALTVLAAPAHAAASAVSMPLLSNMHSCDFRQVNYVSQPGKAEPVAQITSDGHSATARVDVKWGTPNTQYVVRLIPAPHAALGCQAGDPGVGTTTLATDASGSGSATAQTAITAGTTGVWVTMELPAAHSQTPQEFYSPTFIAAV
jgi:hypothetical protein